MVVSGFHTVMEGFRFYESVKHSPLRYGYPETGLDRYGELSYEVWRRCCKEAFETVGHDAQEPSGPARIGESLAKLDGLIQQALEQKRSFKVRLAAPNKAGQLEELVDRDAPDLANAARLMHLRMKLLGQLEPEVATQVAISGNVNIGALIDDLDPTSRAIFEKASREAPTDILMLNKPGVGGTGRAMYSDAPELPADISDEERFVPATTVRPETDEEHFEAFAKASKSFQCVVCDSFVDETEMHVSGACTACMDVM